MLTYSPRMHHPEAPPCQGSNLGDSIGLWTARARGLLRRQATSPQLTQRGAQAASFARLRIDEALAKPRADAKLQLRARLPGVVAGRLEQLVGQGEFENRPERLHVLAAKGSRGVRQVVLVAQLAHPHA